MLGPVFGECGVPVYQRVTSLVSTPLAKLYSLQYKLFAACSVGNIALARRRNRKFVLGTLDGSEISVKACDQTVTVFHQTGAISKGPFRVIFMCLLSLVSITDDMKRLMTGLVAIVTIRSTKDEFLFDY